MPRFAECWRCGRSGNSAVCRACGVAKYCSKACQKDDTLRHESECKPVAIIKTCSSCGKSGIGLQVCTGCYKAHYCGIQCQKSHRRDHKPDCKATEDKIEKLAQRMFVYYAKNRINVFPIHYYWGNVPAFDALNLPENEGDGYSSDLKLLYLGVGDLRNVALTCAQLPDTYGHVLTFALNDRESSILARLVLLLYMLINGEASVEKIVTEVWYSILLSKRTYEYLIACLRALIDCASAIDLATKTSGFIAIHDEHLKELKNVWIRWHNLKVRGTTWIQSQRERFFSSNPRSFEGRESYFNAIPQEHVKSAKKWMKDGVFERDKMPAFAENPTLTGYNPLRLAEPYSYCIPEDVLPFTGWDYLEVKKVKHSHSLVTMYGEFVENILTVVMKKLLRKQLLFHIILCDCREVELYTAKDTTYDRVLTTNMMDYFLLPDLLRLSSRKLNHDNPFATIVTETQNWTRDFCPDADKFTSIAPILILRKIAIQDTKNPRMDDGTGIREYLDNSAKFVDFVRALFFTYAIRNELEDDRKSPRYPKVPTVKVLGNEFRLELRDGFRNENRIVPFKLAVNRRRVTMVTGLERNLEWMPLKSK